MILLHTTGQNGGGGNSNNNNPTRPPAGTSGTSARRAHLGRHNLNKASRINFSGFHTLYKWTFSLAQKILHAQATATTYDAQLHLHNTTTTTKDSTKLHKICSRTESTAATTVTSVMIILLTLLMFTYETGILYSLLWHYRRTIVRDVH